MLVERLGGEVAIEPQIITGEGVKAPMLVGFIRTATPRLLIQILLRSKQLNRAQI